MMIFETILGISFTFIMTIAGASLVFFFKNDISEKLNSIFNGLSAGIMLAATICSLIIPSINHSEHLGDFNFVPVTIGIILGFVFIILIDLIIKAVNKKEKGLDKNMKLFLAITLHNIPEGLAVGFAFGAALNSGSQVLLLSAISLAIGMGLQNFPEGAAISLPIKKTQKNRFKAFSYGLYSALVEPIASLAGIFLAYCLSSILSYILAFAAGAMLFVLVEELLPEFCGGKYFRLGSWCFLIGFVLMMILDVVFG